MSFRKDLMHTAFHLGLLALCAFPSFAHARAGTGDIGGGASVCTTSDNKVHESCDELLDVNMKRSRRDVTKLPIFSKRVAPVLAALDAAVPDFGAEIREGLTAKRWYFTKASIPELGEGNDTGFKTKQRAIQYQDRDEIWIDQAWFNKQDEDGQAGIIFHELAMHIRLKTIQVLTDEEAHRENPDTLKHMLYHRSNKGISVSDVRALTELLISDLPSAEELQAELKGFSFGSYLTGEQKRSFDTLSRDTFLALDKACQLADTKPESASPRLLALYQAMKPISDSVAVYQTRLNNNVPLTKQIYISYVYENLGLRIQDGRDAHDVMYVIVDHGLEMPLPGENREYVPHNQVCDHTVTGGNYNCMDGITRTCDYASQVVKARYSK